MRLAAVIATLWWAARARSEEVYDVAVYGATPGGVLAADAAAGESPALRVVLLDPRPCCVGGMMSGGMGITDKGRDDQAAAAIGGRTRAFFQQVQAYYGKDTDYNFEPHVAEGIFKNYFLASKPNLALRMGARIVSLASEPGVGGAPHISEATCADGSTIRAQVWVDASYEGFLLPLANVSYVYGRESAAEFNESVAGVLPEPWPGATPAHPFNSQGQLWRNISAFWPNGSLIPGVYPAAPGPVGSGDLTMQAYNFRITLTNNISNMLQPWPRPAQYDADALELLKRRIRLHNASSLSALGIGMGSVGNLPTRAGGGESTKSDINSQVLDFQGLSWPYAPAVAAGDWAAQEAVWAAHRDRTLGYFYFLQNDASVPAALRADTLRVGLALDEHAACWHLPCQLYVREALRLRGDFVLTQADREVAVNKTDSIGMGTYSVDTMHGWLFPDPADPFSSLLQEGGMQSPSFIPASLPPWQLPWRALLPRRAEAGNLIVCAAVSATHVAFNAVRLEPTWMVLGESAGVAAAAFARNASLASVQDLDVPALQARLRALGQVLELPAA